MQLLFASLVAIASLVAGCAAETTTPATLTPSPIEATAPTPETARVWATSPWGFSDLYAVCPGWNRLVCSGTGLLFNFYYRGV